MSNRLGQIVDRLIRILVVYALIHISVLHILDTGFRLADGPDSCLPTSGREIFWDTVPIVVLAIAGFFHSLREGGREGR